MSLPRIPIDDPRVVVLARARQQLAHRGVLAPTWDELTDEERAGSLPDARNYLESAINAGLIDPAWSSPDQASKPDECPVCFALVREERADDHAAWHDGARGRLVLAGRRLLQHLTGVSVAVVARERDSADWTLLLGTGPQQSHLRILERIQEVASRENIPIRLDDLLVTDASRLAQFGGISFGDVTFIDGVPVHTEGPA